MANTYTALHYHIVFSTKNHQEWIQPDIEERMWSYIAGIAVENRIKPVCIGGTSNHAHVLIGVPPSLALSNAVQFLKGGSSRWAKAQTPALSDFAWQDGYGAFTVSKSQLQSVEAYIRDQAEHHRRKTFQEEYREFLQKHGVVFDERYYLD